MKKFACVYGDDNKVFRIPLYLLPAYIGDGYKRGFTDEMKEAFSEAQRARHALFPKRMLVHHSGQNVMKYIDKPNFRDYQTRGWCKGYLPGAKLVENEKKIFTKPKNSTSFGQSSNWEVISPEGKLYLINNLSRFCRTRGLDYDAVRYGKTEWKTKRV